METISLFDAQRERPLHERMTPFLDFPIKFKEVNPEDFDTPFEVEDKIIIKPNDNGYINDEIQNNIDLNTKNTVVINAGVGQGKSYAIIQTIKRYYEKIKDGEKYLIFVASPFVSLVKQYVNDIHTDTGISKDAIFDYNELGRNPNPNYIKPIQVITANTLLGNPGEDSFKNSEAKRKYLNSLSAFCKDRDIKVVFIYDEIHDSYQNFRQEYIYNLWKWKDVIHKNFVISATFNEASKIVIKYLAELTDKKIKIIESKRIRFPEKQSKLFLKYSNDSNFSIETSEINEVIKKMAHKGKNIDILCYSKNLAKNLINSTLLKEISKNQGIEINDCTSQLKSNSREENEEPKNRYDENKINIGTNFKTGVSIRKENHAFIIIMPPRGARLPFKNLYGIFSGGINSVIQALARQRKKGEIHIILGKPDKFDFESLTTVLNEWQLEVFKLRHNKNIYITSNKEVKYLDINNQYTLLKEFYDNKLIKNIENEIKAIENEDRKDLPPINYPTLDTFILENGENYLANEYPFFGGDINAYVSYASITNQFLNCRLEYIDKKYIFKIGSLDRISEELIKKLKSESFNKFYQVIEGIISEEFNINQEANKQIIGWCYKKYYDTTDVFNRKNYLQTKLNDLKNGLITSEGQKQLYDGILYFVEKIYSEIKHYNQRNQEYDYIVRAIPTNFSDEDKEKIGFIERNITSDEVLEFFNFSRNIANKDNVNTKIQSLIKMLRDDFLILDEGVPKPKINGVKTPVRVVLAQAII